MRITNDEQYKEAVDDLHLLIKEKKEIEAEMLLLKIKDYEDMAFSW